MNYERKATIMFLLAQMALTGCAAPPSGAIELTARAQSTVQAEDEEESEKSICPAGYNLWWPGESLMIGNDELKFLRLDISQLQNQEETGNVMAVIRAKIASESPVLEYGFTEGLNEITVPLTGDEFGYYFSFWNLEIALAKAGEDLVPTNAVCYRLQ